MTVRLDNVSYWYPETVQPALSNITWEPSPGLNLVVGDSGSGKSTMLRTLNGLVPHFYGGKLAGAIFVNGADTCTTPVHTLARTVGFVFQDPELQSVGSTVERDVAFGLQNLGLSGNDITRRVSDALGIVGLTGFAGRRVRTLSGGERQRVALAGALAMGSSVIVLDEPLSQLDTDGARDVIDACTVAAHRGTTIVISEHRHALFPGDVATVVVERGMIARTCSRADITLPRPFTPPTRTAGDIAWECDSLSLTHGRSRIIELLSAHGRAGEVVAFTGRNGSGKTTLLRAIAGLHPAEKGHVTCRGTAAYLPQNPSLILFQESVRKEIERSLLLSKRGNNADPWLEMFALTSVAYRYARDLSTGERQRAAIASILCTEPDVALLDEPTRGMDTHARAQLIDAVNLLASRGTAIVIATHDRELIEALGVREISLDAAPTVHVDGHHMAKVKQYQ